MAIVNHIGAIGTETWNLTADEHHITGNCTINAASTITVSPGTNPIPIRFDGDFNITSTTDGQIVSNGTASTRIRWQMNGAPSTWPPIVTMAPYIFNGGTGTGWSFSYNDFYNVSITYAASAGSWSVSNCRVYHILGGTANSGIRIVGSGGTANLSDIEVYYVAGTGYGIRYDSTGGSVTIQRVYVYGCARGVLLAPGGGGPNTLSGIKVVRCRTGVEFGGTLAVSVTDLITLNCYRTHFGTPAGGSQITRYIAVGWSQAANLSVPLGQIVTFTEAYSAQSLDGEVGGTSNIRNDGAGTCKVMNGVFVLYESAIPTAGACLIGCESNNNDLIRISEATLSDKMCISGGTSNNDYMAGTHGGYIGPIPAKTGQPHLYDWADANFTQNVDATSGSITSTHVPTMYTSLAAARTLARTSPNLPLTISAISSGTPGQDSVTITFNTGIRAKSRILLSTTSGFSPLSPEYTSLWKYHGAIDPDITNDFTLTTSVHSHTLTTLKPGQTYYYRIECVDPCGRRFLSTEQTFATQQAGGAGTGENGIRYHVRR